MKLLNAIPLERNEDYIPLIWLLIALILTAVINVIYRRKMLTQLEGFLKFHSVQQIMREENSSSQRPITLMMLNSTLIVGVCIYSFLVHYGTISINDWKSLGLIFLSLFGAFIYFMFTPWLVKFLYNDEAGLNEYRYNYILIFQVLGLVLIPLAINMSYGSIFKTESAYAAILIMVIFHIMRIIRGIIIGFSKRIFVIYIILYLCTLEILPLIVLYGLFNGQISMIN